MSPRPSIRAPAASTGRDRGRPETVGRDLNQAENDPGNPSGNPRGNADPERGSATVLAVGVLAATVVLAAGFVAVGQAGAARHQAQGAADAAALAGAAKVLLGPGEACAAAEDLVAENRAEMESCEVSDLEVMVRVTTEPAGIGALFGPARAASRAGPVTAL